MKTYCAVSHGEERKLIAERIEVALRFFPRLRGLLGRKNLKDGEGLLLWPCSAVHCFGMRFPIDTIFLDSRFRVVSIRENLMPGSHAAYSLANYVLELKSGEVMRHKIQYGEQLIISFGSHSNSAE